MGESVRPIEIADGEATVPRRWLTLSTNRVSRRTLDREALSVPLDEHPHAGHGAPRTWGECVELGLGDEIPCPFVSCAYHLALDVTESGTIRLRWPDADGGVDLDAMPATCALRVASDGEHTLDGVGEAIGATRERVRQVEERALAALEGMLHQSGVRCVDDVAPGVAWCSRGVRL